ncbi:putative ATP-grasp-modified RiPP [Amycolatopsis cynarae]|uniref:ATP-grasp-modified RiPP n=1 Tax=Amycolatopsis cynarae TaxID=2995223 RepID=A0ABY7BBW5_9PSEU|nr:putative ATP-grasp-modified RiPP [Amycolatopsis sp. HUAS 11-8]WAL68722.1 putative ATP-grasp-modified RiPP [Amycolatopsis sp. HUAS 11-8]
MDNGATGMPGRPWGATRMGPYPLTVQVPFTAVDIDPATQLGVFRDASGRIVNMQRTRQPTSDSTSTSTSTYTSTSTGMVDSSDSDDSGDSDSNSDFNSDEYSD